MNPNEQIGRGRYVRGGRSWNLDKRRAKRAMKRWRRRMWQHAGENAPKQERYRGWVW